MSFKISDTNIVIDYTFFLLLSFAVFYGYKNAVLIIIFSCLHELGHLLCLLILKVKPQKIKISFYGISMKYDNRISKINEIFVYLCGPLVNLILYLLFRDEINLALFIINMYPVLPLDGGRIMYAASEKLSNIISAVFITALLAFSVYMLIKFGNFSLLLIAVYLIIFNLNQMRFL